MRSIPNVNHVSDTDLKVLACPARFERATSTLEEIVAIRFLKIFNHLNTKQLICKKEPRKRLFQS